MRALDEPALATLQSLAIISRSVETRELAAVTGLSSDRLAAVLERLVRSQFVTEAQHGRDLSYELAHPLLQEAIYQRISEVRDGPCIVSRVEHWWLQLGSARRLLTSPAPPKSGTTKPFERSATPFGKLRNVAPTTRRS